MPSDAKKQKALARKQAAQKKHQPKNKEDEAGPSSSAADGDATKTNGLSGNSSTASLSSLLKNGLKSGNASSNSLTGLARSEKDKEGADLNAQLEEIENEIINLDLTTEEVAKHRSTTGVLASQRDSRDCQFVGFGITFHGVELLVDCKLDINNGRRYGLIGPNGCGKSTLLAVLSNREIDIPNHIDIFHLQREMPPSEKTALECVMEVDEERLRLESEAEELTLLSTECEDDDQAAIIQDRLMELYDRLDSLDAVTAPIRAAELLSGLGFTPEMQAKKVKHFSGGWRMRISLARALFVKPALLLLDEPTNHLDLEACVWLEEELSKYPRALIVISHSQDFLNGVCTNIIQIFQKKIKYFGGNYDQYIKTKSELEDHQMKQYKWEQDQIAHMKDYIARFGHGSRKLARQAQSKEKTLQKMVDGGLTERVQADKSLSFYFPDCGTLPPPIIQVQSMSFRYGEDKPYIYKNVDFGADLDTRVALVGPNGAGKSTLLKLIAGELEPTDGMVRRHSHLRIGRYHQHLHEMLDLNNNAIDWMLSQFPAVKERDTMRKFLGRYGVTGGQQVCAIKALSDGQRCRIIFAWLAQKAPHMLLLDEPTNHLDIETIDTLADALNNFDGGLLLVSHDFRLIQQVADEIWLCDNQTVNKWDKGDIFSYKQHLAKIVSKQKRLAATVTQR